MGSIVNAMQRIKLNAFAPAAIVLITILLCIISMEWAMDEAVIMDTKTIWAVEYGLPVMTAYIFTTIGIFVGMVLEHNHKKWE